MSTDMSQSRQLAAIMFTDIQGYTFLMQEDEERAIEFRKKHRKVFNDVTSRFGGKVLQYYGDGTLSVFNSAIEAVQCGIEMQLQFLQEPKIPVRIGINIGDIFFNEEEVVGDGINVASRIEKLAEPGTVFISAKVYDEIKNQQAIETLSLGRFDLENEKSPVEIFAIVNEGLQVPKKGHIQGKIESLDIRKPESGRRYFPKSGRIVLAALVLFVLASIVLVKLTDLFQAETSPQVDKSIAVLPFANLSNDPQQEYFIDGVTEEIINHLVKIRDLKVISRTSIMYYKNSSKSLEEIGSELGVSNILEGSIQKYGDEIRVSAQLTQVNTEHTLWSETYDRQLSNIFAIQTDLALNIAKALKAKLSEQERAQIEKEPTQSLSGYNSYLKALYHFDQYSAEGYYKAIDLLKQSTKVDTNFGSGYALLALCHIYLASWAGDLTPEDAKKEAIPVALKALEIDENLYQAHNALALIYFWFDWNFVEAEKSFKKALEIAPGGVSNIFYQQFLINMGNFEEALVLGKKSMETDPLHFGVYLETGLSHFFLKQYDQAEEVLKMGIELHPAILDLRIKLGKVYLNIGKYDLAIAQLEEGLSFSSIRPPSILAYLAVAYTGKGGINTAQELLDELVARHSRREKGIAYYIAHVYSGLGNDEQAMEWLENAYRDHEVELIWLKVEAQFKNLHGNPKFQDLLKRIGFR
jgi:TolB-like protein/class 3 adenylate cyclase/Tfp pilus assembly protein PilF